MYLRVSRVHFDSAKYDEMLPLVQQVPGAVQGLPGNQSVSIGMDRATGSGNVVSIWDTAEHAGFNRETAPKLGEVVRKIMTLGMQIDPPEIAELLT